MLTRIIYITLLALCPAAVFPQGYTVSGYVKDSITTESLIGANIYRQNTGQGTSANRYGCFSTQNTVRIPVSAFEGWYYSGTVTDEDFIDGDGKEK